MISADHPLTFARELADKHNLGLRLSFSRYFYRPNSVFDERSMFWVDAAELNREWLVAEIASLPEGWELAFNSILRDRRGRTHHVAMIDFAENVAIGEIKAGVHRMLGDDALRALRIYDSGRSYHGYIDELLIPREWREFLGRLLLMNDLSRPPVVDARWVGHRLVGGYCALRWSQNSSWYRKMPTRVA